MTSKQEKDRFIEQGSEISLDLLTIFKSDEPIVVADIGACDGLSSIIYAKLFPNSFIYAFEPRPDNYAEMNSNFVEYGLTGRFQAWRLALGDKVGSVEFYESYGDAPGKRPGWETGNKSSSLLKPKKHLEDHKWCQFRPQSVSVKPLDSLALHKVDFAHIDVQGAEDKVLRGGRRTFKNTKAIWIEVANVELYEGQAMKNEIMRMLHMMGFKIVKDTCDKQHSGDLLCVR